MDSSFKSDADFLDGLRNGQPEAFRKLVEDHKRRVVNICYRFVDNREDAEDIAQDTFVEVHRSVAGFREASELSTWIYRIAVSKSMDFIRRGRRQKRGGKLKRLLRLEDEAVDVPSPASDRPDVKLEEKERRRVLYQALGRLPKKQQIAFVLSQYDGLSYREISGVLKTTVSAVESLIHRARTNLQKILYKYYENRV